MLEITESCREFRDTLHRALDQDLELVNQASFVGHLHECSRCRSALHQYNEHIQAHRILAAGGRLDAESAQALELSLPSHFGAISDRIVRKRARELGRLKFEILRVYLKHILSEHNWPRVLDADELSAAQTASHTILDKLERYKESDIIFADGGRVNLRSVREVLDKPMDPEHEGLDHQLRTIARGLLTARTLDPELDEHVLQQLGVILERLGYFREARDMFLQLARLPSNLREHLQAKALNSAARTSFRFLSEFGIARQYLEEADRLYPERWTVEYNFASFYLWPSNPLRDASKAAAYFDACRAHVSPLDKLTHLLSQDDTMRRLFAEAGILSEA